MSQLLLPAPRGSFVRESIEFALREQRRVLFGGAWGISESAFFAFDSEMNYQYKASGIQSLSLKRYGEQPAILSPYSTFLALPFCPREALANLRRLEAMGARGKYGFYEAVDFTPPYRRRGRAGLRLLFAPSGHEHRRAGQQRRSSTCSCAASCPTCACARGWSFWRNARPPSCRCGASRPAGASASGACPSARNAGARPTTSSPRAWRCFRAAAFARRHEQRPHRAAAGQAVGQRLRVRPLFGRAQPAAVADRRRRDAAFVAAGGAVRQPAGCLRKRRARRPTSPIPSACRCRCAAGSIRRRKRSCSPCGATARRRCGLSSPSCRCWRGGRTTSRTARFPVCSSTGNTIRPRKRCSFTAACARGRKAPSAPCGCKAGARSAMPPRGTAVTAYPSIRSAG